MIIFGWKKQAIKNLAEAIKDLIRTHQLLMDKLNLIIDAVNALGQTHGLEWDEKQKRWLNRDDKTKNQSGSE